MARTKFNLAPIKKKFEELERRASAKVTREVATTIRAKMLDLIGKGISPIEGNGRFPAYKAAKEFNRKRGLISSLRSAARSRAQDFGAKDADVRAARSAARGLSKNLKSGYPFSVNDKFPGKRLRPVNLYLSGKFLRDLKAFPMSVNKIAIGFFSDRGKKLEQGHREGANGQAKRPIIPQDGEEFAKSIQSAILKLFRESILRELKK